MAAGDFIIPEVYADLAQAAFVGKVKVYGSPAVIQDTTLVGQPGETVHFPKWGALGELDDLTVGVAMTPTELEQTEASATIKEAGKAVVINDRDKLTALGNPQSEAVRQFGVLASRKVDGDLIAEAIAAAPAARTVTAAAGQTTLAWARLVELFATFGDEFDGSEFAGIYINSAQMADVFNDTTFIEASKVGDNNVIRRGTIGLLGGIPVQVTDRVAAKTVLAIKNASLGALSKRAPLVETDRDVLKRQDVVTTNIHYAVKAVNPLGIGKLVLAAA